MNRGLGDRPARAHACLLSGVPAHQDRLEAPGKGQGQDMQARAMMMASLLTLVSFAARPETTAAATGSGGACLLEAREELQSCSAECVNDFRNERFTCRNVEPGCGRECLGHR